MKTKHYYLFERKIQDKIQGNSLNKENWDILRTDRIEGAFAIEKDIESFERNCMGAEKYRKAAKIIYNLLASADIEFEKIISLGVGKGILEWHLKKLRPEVAVECTDYTVKAVEQLKQVFLNIDAAYPFDILNGDYTRLDKNAVFVMYRVSTEFNLKEWYKIFKDMYDAGITYILYVPTGLNNFYDMFCEKKAHIKNIIKGRKDIQCGWIYSEREYLKMFKGGGRRPLYRIKEKKYFDGTAAFLLTKNY